MIRAALTLTALVALGPGCRPPAPTLDRTRLEAALAAYRGAVLATDSAALARMFTEDAEVAHGSGTPIRGRPAIRAFLESFAGYRVLDYALTPDTFEATAETAEQSGRYRQTVLAADGRRLTVEGRFRARWRLQADGSLRLARMHTESMP